MMDSLPDYVRVSIGTATVLSLELTLMGEKPTTAYLQTFWDGRCTADCRFCAQARKASGEVDKIARALYTAYPTNNVFQSLEKAWIGKKIFRVCFQTINYVNMIEDLINLVKRLNSNLKIPVSVSIHAIPKDKLFELRDAGVKMVVIPLDAASERVFDEIKGWKAHCPYKWEKHWEALEDALEVFGEGNVGTHLIVGLGETEFELTQTIQQLHEKKIHCGLFSFTPITGTPMEKIRKPSIIDYRVVQLTHYLVFQGYINIEDVRFDEKKRIVEFNLDRKKLLKVVNSGKPFQTSGCPNCNRPYATESPSRDIYNYPRPLNRKEIETVKTQLTKRISLAR